MSGRKLPAGADSSTEVVEQDSYRGLFDNSPVSLWVEDFSELKVHLEQLREYGVGDLRHFFRNRPDEVLKCASLVKVVDVNQATLELLECDDKNRLLGRLPAFFRKSSYDLFFEEMIALAEGKTVFEMDALNHTFRSREINVRLRLTVAPGYEETWGRVFASVTDISAWKKAEAQLRRMAQFDSLTGLPNRATFIDRLAQEARRSTRCGGPVNVLMLDLDNFKDVNDAFGHPTGDAFLCVVADRLRKSFRNVDTVARLGGDEFAILQTDSQQPADILATRLLSVFEEPIEIEGYSIPTSVSIGISYSETGEVDSEQMIRQADLALYTAKEEGRGTFRFHDVEMDRDVRERLALSRELQDAIAKGQLFLTYQPMIDVASGRISGLEALLRWNHREKGLLLPDRFVPIAENNGLIIEIGDWVLGEACRSLKALRALAGEELYVSINLSPAQLRLPGFALKLLRVLDSEGLLPDAVELELGERVLIRQSRQIEQTLEDLRRAGVRFSVDDFGAGYSSMLYLRGFSFDKLKIAQSLLKDVDTDKTDAGIVSALIALGQKLGLKVLAKGVEREGQLEFLRKSGCTEAQGYFFSPAVSLDKATELIQAQSSSKA